MKTYLAIWPDNSVTIAQVDGWALLFQALDIDADPFQIKALWDLTGVQVTRTHLWGGLTVIEDKDFPAGAVKIPRARFTAHFQRSFERMYCLA